MDESLKARLIGATVLVVIAVVLVPEVLSGRRGQGAGGPPGEHGTRSFTIDLTGAGSAGGAPAAGTPAGPVAATAEPAVSPTGSSRVQPAVTAADAPAPAVTADTVRGDGADDVAPAPTVAVNAAGAATNIPAPATPPRPAVATPATAPGASTAAPASRPPAAKGSFAVQVGAFGSTQGADKVVRELHAAGFDAYVSPVQRSGKTLFRVRVGPVAERSRADSMAATLKGRGLPATVVAND